MYNMAIAVLSPPSVSATHLTVDEKKEEAILVKGEGGNELDTDAHSTPTSKGHEKSAYVVEVRVRGEPAGGMEGHWVWVDGRVEEDFSESHADGGLSSISCVLTGRKGWRGGNVRLVEWSSFGIAGFRWERRQGGGTLL
jgi:hypothetical protein